jgi:hypothetical protein
MRRNLKDALRDAKPTQELAQKERDFFQKPSVPSRPDRSAGWDAQPEWSGASWSGERVRGNWGGGRDR